MEMREDEYKEQKDENKKEAETYRKGEGDGGEGG